MSNLVLSKEGEGYTGTSRSSCELLSNCDFTIFDTTLKNGKKKQKLL